MKSAIILAAGKGTRMKSDKPKCMHKVCDKTMIEHIIDTAKAAGATQVITIVGHQHEEIEEHLKGQCEFALQEQQLGTGHAVMQAKQCEDQDGVTLVINGDCPCIQKETLERLYQEAKEYSMVLSSIEFEDTKPYGRIVRDQDGWVKKIVEYKDCTEEEKKIKEMNAGIYAFDNQVLFSSLKELNNDNMQKEYYITDLVEIINQKGMKIQAIKIDDVQEVLGINDQVELAQANRYMQDKINLKWMREGVVMIDPSSTWVGADVQLEASVTLYPNITLEGKTKIAKGSTIFPQCFFNNAIIGENCNIRSSQIMDSEVKAHCNVGPFAHFRGNTIVEEKNRIGNFVEFKNTHFGYDSRCAHLTYLGDSTVGSKVNIGCGVVTVNYDGKNKFKTVIEDEAFVGSNSNLIAPITVGKRAVVAAGSTVTEDIHSGDMAIARSRQENKPGYGDKYKNK